jgi:LCP family protein required for cell wall assembly
MRYVDLENEKLENKSNRLKRGNTNFGVKSERSFGKMILRRWRGIALVCLGLVFVLMGWYVFVLAKSLNVKAQDLIAVPGAAVDFVTKKGPQLENTDGRTNVLLLGIGGEGHEGPYLTDSIMVASANLETGEVVLLSLPRDIWVSRARSKINAVYAFARQKEVKSGLPSARSAVEEILGIPIHYAVRIDFDGFRRAIDLLGGLDVEVARGFTDRQYPIEGKERDTCGLSEIEVEIPQAVSGIGLEALAEGSEGLSKEVKIVKEKRWVDSTGVDKTDDPTAFSCRYETISFSQGLMRMDGKTALKFVRSRHGTNNEGSDFARADRQQRVISAFKSKVLSVGTILNLSRVTSLIEEFGSSVEMDITLADYGEFVKLARLTQGAEIRTHTISAEGEEALLAVPPSREPYGGAYVLVPKIGNWSDVHAKVQEWLADQVMLSPSSTSPSPPKL